MLKRAQDIVSQSKRTAASYEETLKEVLIEFFQRKDPVEKAKRNVKRNVNKMKLAEVKTKNITAEVNAVASVPDISKKNLRYIPAPLKHNIYMRDNGQCRYVNNGKRCENRRWLDIHHKIPLAKGGPMTEENLITLCSAHHKQQHFEVGIIKSGN